jgi:sulfonate transport system ATP-binding protein
MAVFEKRRVMFRVAGESVEKMLTLDRLTKSYDGGVAALEELSLSVDAGEVVAVIGGSGSGKTTLLRLIAGLEQSSAGSITLDREAIRGPHPAIGFVFQEPRLFPWLTVAENVGFGLAHLPSAQRRKIVETALTRVELGAYQDRWPRELSGGQAQRAALSRALAVEPKVLLLDEPFSALDALTRANLHEHLLSLWRAYRPTLLLVTHDVEEAVKLADRVMVLQPRPGRLFAEIIIDLPRPRDLLSAAFTQAKSTVLDALAATMGAVRVAE